MKYLREDFVDKAIKGKYIQPDLRELYIGLARYAMEQKLLSNIEELPEFLTKGGK